MSAPMLDTYREVITPEGVPLHLPVAGPLPRALAWAIDFVIRVGALMMLSIPLAFLGGFGQGLYLGLMFLLMWAYTIVQEACWGRTL
ncbi:MAG TPA: RDD family protein, partial [Stenotrophomonas sp.]|nr:RDD family protein [Stenotrophomonas sp.]